MILTTPTASATKRSAMSSPFIGHPPQALVISRFRFPVPCFPFAFLTAPQVRNSRSYPLHEARQALPAAQAHLGEKRFEVLANHLVQDALLRMATDLRAVARTANRRQSCSR